MNHPLFIQITQPNSATCGEIKPLPCVEIVYFLLAKYIFHIKTVGKPLWFTHVNLCKLQEAHDFDAVFTHKSTLYISHLNNTTCNYILI